VGPHAAVSSALDPTDTVLDHLVGLLDHEVDLAELG
jgi:hypothetical protein